MIVTILAGWWVAAVLAAGGWHRVMSRHGYRTDPNH